MPLNYSKWDQLELSDDSDIEGHPNVDKRSLIRWKQRDIHEKREARKHKIAALEAEIACNRLLQPRLTRVRERIAGAPASPKKASTDEGSAETWAEDAEDTRSLTGLPLFQSLVERFQTGPSPAAPPTSAPNQPTYDAMILSLLLQIYESVKSLPKDEQEKGVLDGLDKHVKQLGEHTQKLLSDLDQELKEQKKHITSDDIKEGWESKYVPAKPTPAPIKNAITETPQKKTTTTKTTTYEVLNPSATSASAAPTPAPDEDEPADLPELTPSLARFSRLPLWDYAQSFAFIQANRDVVVPGASDALLVAAFRAQSDGEITYAKQCVHQSLLLQYCDKLGRDGVRVFFQKMIAGDKRAVPIFVKDVEGTYAHLVTRAAASAAASTSKEQIQLVPETPSSTISFNVPDGPPPDDLVLEGPGTEGLDVEEVRKALHMRWSVFDGFSEKLKDALREGSLEGVNKVLGEMEVAEAEDVVAKLDMAGIMSFAEGGIRDETGNAEEGE
ncbi:Cdc37 N terminal kinase binding-domain-containing protein [Phlebopus sp. FC_14]|nr:Cdc37 N terminal kinase binding-domain-containing protein [Phlebopus sp. FC_14]